MRRLLVAIAAAAALLQMGPARGLPEIPPPIPVATGAAVVTPTSLTFFGDNLYVASYAQGTIYRFAVLPGGLLAPGGAYATGFSSPLGVVFAPDGTMFVSDSHDSSTPGRTTAGRVWAVAPGGSKSVVVDELPNGRHNTNGMEVVGDRIYITNGNSTDDGVSGGDPEEPLSGTLISVPVTARGLGPTSPEVILEASGMRNLYDVAFRPGTSEAWIPTNGPDFLEPFGEDTLVKANVAGGAPDFGFPGCVYAANPTRAGDNVALGEGSCDPAHTPPEELLGLHPSADGLAFGPDDTYWGGDLFIAEFGNFFGNEVVGHRVVRVPVDAAGNSDPPVDFFFGAAPLDVAFGPAGTGLYVADFASGQITLLKAPR